MAARYYGSKDTKGGKATIRNKEELDRILKELEGCTYQVEEVKKGERIKKAPIPFTTSTLQQEASKALNFSTQKTMRLAQQLYEGVEVKGHGTLGLITYPVSYTHLDVYKRQMWCFCVTSIPSVPMKAA